MDIGAPDRAGVDALASSSRRYRFDPFSSSEKLRLKSSLREITEVALAPWISGFAQKERAH